MTVHQDCLLQPARDVQALRVMQCKGNRHGVRRAQEVDRYIILHDDMQPGCTLTMTCYHLKSIARSPAPAITGPMQGQHEHSGLLALSQTQAALAAAQRPRTPSRRQP
ncbi:hypothetical protein GmRootA79_50620 [Acidovorax sp. A79]